MQCPYGRRTGPAREYPIFFKSYGARGGPARHRYGHVWELTQPEFASYMAVRGPYGPLTAPARAVHEMCMIFKLVRGPQAYDANCTGPARGGDIRTAPHGPREWTYDVCSKQPGNSPYGARECDVTEASHHTPGPRTGCSRAVLNKNRTSTHGAHTGPLRRRTDFASPYGARRVLMYAL